MQRQPHRRPKAEINVNNYIMTCGLRCASKFDTPGRANPSTRVRRCFDSRSSPQIQQLFD